MLIQFDILGLEQKNVIIQRDHYGYGLTVSGDNPVFVLSVRDGGAAHRAGININDQIIKVNFNKKLISMITISQNYLHKDRRKRYSFICLTLIEYLSNTFH